MLSEELKQKRQELIKMTKKKRNTETYQKRKEEKQCCAVCFVEVDKYYYDKHCETSRHKKFLEYSKEIKN
jgi:hypothetical protein